jgi:hypothetical protein
MTPSPPRHAAIAFALALLAGIALAACIDFQSAKEAYCAEDPDACEALLTDAGVGCSNGAQDGTETDVDCGGGTCATKCDLNEKCVAATDCASAQCNPLTHLCTAGPCADGVKNNQETDIDCGGGGSCPKCERYKACALPTDCVHDNCDANQKCALYPLSWSYTSSRACGRDHTAAATSGDVLLVMGRAMACEVSVPDPGVAVEYLELTATNWEQSSAIQFNSKEGMQLVRAAGGHFYLMGGFSDSQTSASKSTFGTDGGTNFKPLTSMGSSRAYAAAAALPDGRVFIAGGHDTDITTTVNALASTEVFSPDPTLATGGSWTAGPPLGVYRAGAAAAATDQGEVFVMGGVLKLTQVTALNTIETFPADGGSPSTRVPMPTPRAFFGMTMAPDGRIYAAGGVTQAGVSASVEAFDPASGTWTRIPDMPSNLSHLALTVGPDNRLYAIGGKNSGGNYEKNTYAYGPYISLTPTTGTAGTLISVTGNLFPPSTEVSVYLDSLASVPVATGISRSTAQLPTNFAFPVPTSLAPGKHDVFVRDVKSRYPVRAVLTVP